MTDTDLDLDRLETYYQPCPQGRLHGVGREAWRQGSCWCDHCLHGQDPEALKLIAEVRRLREENERLREIVHDSGLEPGALSPDVWAEESSRARREVERLREENAEVRTRLGRRQR